MKLINGPRIFSKKSFLIFSIVIWLSFNFSVFAETSQKREVCRKALSRSVGTICKLGTCIGLGVFSQTLIPAPVRAQEWVDLEDEIHLNNTRNNFQFPLDLDLQDKIARFQRLLTQDQTEQAGCLQLQQLLEAPETGKCLVRLQGSGPEHLNGRSAILQILASYYASHPSPQINQASKNFYYELGERLSVEPMESLIPRIYSYAAAENGFLILEKTADFYFERSQFYHAARFLQDAISILPEKNRAEKTYKEHISRIWNKLARNYLLARDRAGLEELINKAQEKRRELPHLYEDIELGKWSSGFEGPSARLSRDAIDLYGPEYVSRVASEFFDTKGQVYENLEALRILEDYLNRLSFSPESLSLIVHVAKESNVSARLYFLSLARQMSPKSLAVAKAIIHDFLNNSTDLNHRSFALSTLAQLSESFPEREFLNEVNKISENDFRLLNNFRSLISQLRRHRMGAKFLLSAYESAPPNGKIYILNLLANFHWDGYSARVIIERLQHSFEVPGQSVYVRLAIVKAIKKITYRFPVFLVERYVQLIRKESFDSAKPAEFFRNLEFYNDDLPFFINLFEKVEVDLKSYVFGSFINYPETALELLKKHTHQPEMFFDLILACFYKRSPLLYDISSQNVLSEVPFSESVASDVSYLLENGGYDTQFSLVKWVIENEANDPRFAEPVSGFIPQKVDAEEDILLYQKILTFLLNAEYPMEKFFPLLMDALNVASDRDLRIDNVSFHWYIYNILGSSHEIEFFKAKLRDGTMPEKAVAFVGLGLGRPNIDPETLKEFTFEILELISNAEEASWGDPLFVRWAEQFFDSWKMDSTYVPQLENVIQSGSFNAKRLAQRKLDSIPR